MELKPCSKYNWDFLKPEKQHLFKDRKYRLYIQAGQTDVLLFETFLLATGINNNFGCFSPVMTLLAL